MSEQKAEWQLETDIIATKKEMGCTYREYNSKLFWELRELGISDLTACILSYGGKNERFKRG